MSIDIVPLVVELMDAIIQDRQVGLRIYPSAEIKTPFDCSEIETIRWKQIEIEIKLSRGVT
jgi:hypothetical protein